MALIHCPECDREISDAANACPNCGFVLKQESQITTSEKSSYASKNYFAPEGTKIEETAPNKEAVFIILAIYISLYILMSFVNIIFGIAMLIPGVFLYLVLIKKYYGVIKYICPYCGLPSEMTKYSKSANAVKCPSCKKTAVISGDMLKPIE